MLRALTGVVAAGAAVGAGHLVAALVNPVASPLLAVGSALIDAAPTPAKEFAVRTFGTADKPILVSSVAVVLVVFIASKSLNKAMFSSGDLPALKEDETYQLWTLAGPLTAPTRVTPDALVGGGSAVKQWFTGPVAQSDALAISIEKAGGASAPTNIQGATAL